ncbi:MAG: hypothetical protein Q8O98_02245 [bacterium]|nr:hypothetical protein [bacterium]
MLKLIITMVSFALFIAVAWLAAYIRSASKRSQRDKLREKLCLATAQFKTLEDRMKTGEPNSSNGELAEETS